MDVLFLREGFPKMEIFIGICHEGGEGVPFSINVFFLNVFAWKPFRITPWLPKRILDIVWALYYVYIVVEVTMNMAKYGSRRSQQPENVNFEPIIRGLKSDIF